MSTTERPTPESLLRQIMDEEETAADTQAAEDRTEYPGVAFAIIRALRRWAASATVPGDFAQAVICNDLREACGRADDRNRVTLFDIVSYAHNEIPSICWGSTAQATEWIERCRQRRIEAAQRRLAAWDAEHAQV